MSDFNLEVAKRQATTKNVFRKSIASDFIPGVLYNSKENYPISIPRKSFEKQFSKAKLNTIFNLKMNGQECRAFIKAYNTSLTQSNSLQHIDFYKIETGTRIKIKVPIKIQGLAKGVTKGGYVEHYAWALKVICDSDKIPEEIKVDISDLDIGERIYVSSLSKIAGVDFLESVDKSIVGVMISSRATSAANASSASEEQSK